MIVAATTLRLVAKWCSRRAVPPSKFLMRPALAILVGILCASCSTVERGTGSRPPSVASAIVLPEVSVPGVQTGHPLQQREVALLSSEYMRRFVCTCGMPDTPLDDGRFWAVQLWGGFAGEDYGRLVLSKDGRRVSLEPPRSGLKRSTRSMLSHNGVRHE